MSILIIVLIVLLLCGAVGSVPYYGYSRGWGYGPSGVLGLILVILLVMLLAGHFR